MSSTAPQDFGVPLLLEDYIREILSTDSITPLCAKCHQPARSRCSACKNIKYCSITCQGLDWPLHKLLCKSYTKTHDARPSPKHKRAIYFPAGVNEKAQFIYLEYNDDSGTPLDKACYFPDTPEEDIKPIGFDDRYLSYWIQILYDSNPEGKRELEKNAALGHAFRGPVVAIAYDKEEGLSAPALHADTWMLNPVVEYARLREEYRGPVFVEQPQERYTDEEWRRIKRRAGKR